MKEYEELIRTEEYWEEIIDSSFWRISQQLSSYNKEKAYLKEKIKELL